MLKKEINYLDFNGNARTETFYFNMTETELAELNIDAGGAIVERLNSIVENQDGVGMAKFFKELIIRAYGEKSEDGRYFEKGDDYALGKRFTRTNAYDVLFRELLGDSTGDKITAFIMGIVPPNIAAQAKANTTPKITSFTDNEDNN